MKAYEIPEAGRTARGTAIINLLQLQPGEKLPQLFRLKNMKKVNISLWQPKRYSEENIRSAEYENIRKTGLQQLIFVMMMN